MMAYPMDRSEYINIAKQEEEEWLQEHDQDVREKAIEKFAEWFDENYDIYQPSYDGGCKVKISTTLTRYFRMLKEKENV